VTQAAIKSYDHELQELRSRLLSLGGKVETEVAESVRAMTERDSARAEAVLHSDREVNRLEVEIDGACGRLLGLRQPSPSDLRFVMTALKIVVDLERVGDLAVNIAERVLALNQAPPLRPVIDLARLAELGQAQLRKALDAFVDQDADKAEEVLAGDALIDALYYKVFNEYLGYMMEDSKNIRRATAYLFIAKHLERLGDHATNVAEMVIFMVRGEDVRHPGSRDLPFR
jgi:phosphate transport system protein